MPDFFVRVELRGAVQAHYVKLSERMRAAGYFEAVQAINGIYKLPSAEFHAIFEEPMTEVQVRDAVQKLADGVSSGAWVLAIKANRWAITSEAISTAGPTPTQQASRRPT
jgi:hypothetical protein